MTLLSKQTTVALTLLAAAAPASVNAGHLFTQASSNTPTWIQQGQGIAIEQFTTEGGGNGRITINIEQPSGGTPAGITQTTNPSDWWAWSAGDVMRINLPLANDTYSYTIAYDAASGACSYDYCGITELASGSNTVPTELTSANASLALPPHGGSTFFPWSIVAVAGEFSLGGYRIYTAAGTLNGTGAGPLDQSSVVTAEEAESGGGPRPINGSGDSVAGLGSTTTYQFDGGTLVTDADLSADFTISDNGGTMEVAQGASQTFSGSLSDESGQSGAFGKSGDGTLVLSGTNTHTGGTTVTGGTLQISDDNNLGAVASDLTLDGGALQTTADITSARDLNIGAAGGAIAAALNTEFAITGALGGTGSLDLTGDGTVILSQDGATTGDIIVSRGRLAVDGVLAARQTIVRETGHLSGVGTINSDLISSGRISAGASPGTMTVSGDVTLNGSSVLDTEIDGRNYSAAGGAGSYDRIVVTGANNVFTAGGTIAPVVRGISGAATNTFTPAIGDSFRIVTTENAQGIAGAFANIDNPTDGLPANTRFDVVYGANAIDLVLTPESFSTLSRDFGLVNATNLAEALDDIRPASGSSGTGDAASLMQGLYTLGDAELARALLQLSGQIHVFALAEMRDTTQHAAGTIVGQARAAARQNRNIWFDVSSHSLSYAEDDYASATDNTATSLWVGTDFYRTETLTFGTGLGRIQSTVDADIYGDADVNTTAIVFYGYGTRGRFDYEAAIVHGQGNMDGNRATALSTGDFSNTFDGDASATSASARLGYGFDIGRGVRMTTWAGGEMTATRSDGYVEDGAAGTALDLDGQSQRHARATFGIQFGGAARLGIHWNVEAGAKRGLRSSDTQIERDASLSGADWVVTGQNITGTEKYLNAGVSTRLGDNWALSANLGVSAADGRDHKSASLGIERHW